MITLQGSSIVTTYNHSPVGVILYGYQHIFQYNCFSHSYAIETIFIGPLVFYRKHFCGNKLGLCFTYVSHYNNIFIIYLSSIFGYYFYIHLKHYNS